jgi:ribosomal protein L11 methyltransferase
VRTWPALLVEGLARDASNVGPSFRPPDNAGPGFSRADDFTRADAFDAALLDFAVAAIDEPSDGAQRLFFHDTAERDRARDALRTAFPDFQFTAIDVPDEDWAARSQANLKAIRVGHIVVAPPWDNGRDPQPGETRIIIQPSMGFGTGHHATTRLCLAALQRANAAGRSVIDVGTGSGVLAIAASLLGASSVIAIDDDADAIQSARENLGFNPAARVDLRVADLRTSLLDAADIVVANLTGTLLTQTAPLLTTLVAPAGRLIMSGLMGDEEAGVSAAFSDFRVLDRNQEDEWCCLVLAREQVFR